MRPLPVLLAGLTAIASSNAEAFQYSSGWTPGQTTNPAPSASATSSFKPGELSGGRFTWSSLLTSGPIGGLFARSGVNISERLEEAKRKAAELPWDERIPMIRDDNFEQLIFNETFATPQEEEARLWFLVVTVTSSQRTGISAVVDQQFNEVYNMSLNEQDLPHVRWGRIDYLNVTRLTTKWGVWRAPMLIVAKDRGKTLRFFHPQSLGVKAALLHDFLLQETWSRKKPWSGPWAPGGSREELLDKFAIFQEKLYFYMTKIPRWMYLVISGGLGSLLIQIFHRKPPVATRPAAAKSAPTATAAVEQQKDSVARAEPANIGLKKGGAQKRKGNKK